MVSLMAIVATFPLASCGRTVPCGKLPGAKNSSDLSQRLDHGPDGGHGGTAEFAAATALKMADAWADAINADKTALPGSYKR